MARECHRGGASCGIYRKAGQMPGTNAMPRPARTEGSNGHIPHTLQGSATVRFAGHPWLGRGRIAVGPIGRTMGSAHDPHWGRYGTEARLSNTKESRREHPSSHYGASLHGVASSRSGSNVPSSRNRPNFQGASP